ncbi:MAPEG family protein [Phenylobacterium sp.]|uniref:MAPEG family protein n=1 Tax=Phenylobacterium sp. TaxID=1871053 RepID=UPI00272FFE1F|nr:MAPEG family protein [Phenylobacterium sp.]MDP1616567.1 MAPEG family protein [Phenylobacterium sp.]
MNRAPIPKDLPAEMARVRRQAALSFLFCAPVLGAAVWWLPQQFEFPAEMGERLAFAARACLLIMLWVLIGVGIIARLRRKSAQDNAGSAYGPPTERLRVPLAFLQNTLEHATLSAFAILALATVEGEAPLAFIVGMVVLFAIGRITFLRGYPHGSAGRAFGVVTTALPIMGAFAWVIYDMVDRLLRAAI